MLTSKIDTEIQPKVLIFLLGMMHKRSGKIKQSNAIKQDKCEKAVKFNDPKHQELSQLKFKTKLEGSWGAEMRKTQIYQEENQKTHY